MKGKKMKRNDLIEVIAVHNGETRTFCGRVTNVNDCGVAIAAYDFFISCRPGETLTISGDRKNLIVLTRPSPNSEALWKVKSTLTISGDRKNLNVLTRPNSEALWKIKSITVVGYAMSGPNGKPLPVVVVLDDRYKSKIDCQTIIYEGEGIIGDDEEFDDEGDEGEGDATFGAISVSIDYRDGRFSYRRIGPNDGEWAALITKESYEHWENVRKMDIEIQKELLELSNVISRERYK